MAHGDRSVDVFVRKLRQKLRIASPAWNYIHTHFGVGYRFAPEVDGGEPHPEHPEAEVQESAPELAQALAV
jgi:DNA-binding winged helix-turn-helix (wHTH) protein